MDTDGKKSSLPYFDGFIELNLSSLLLVVLHVGRRVGKSELIGQFLSHTNGIPLHGREESRHL